VGQKNKLLYFLRRQKGALYLLLVD